jgi:aminoglycoside 3-N-acetyltransferase
MSFTYTKQEFKEGLLSCGIKPGDTLFCHSNIGFFGFLSEAKNTDETCEGLLEVIFEVLGNKGTFVVPTFTYSFGNDKDEKIFDVQNSDAKSMGVFAEYIRNLDSSFRSHDPMFSVCAIGDKAEILTKNVSDECFGRDSFWNRFVECNGKVCNFNFDSGSTLIHYFEKLLQVPYRRDTVFSGKIIDKGRSASKSVTYFCRDLNDPESSSKFERFDRYAKQKYTQTASVGRGSIVVISADEIYNLIKSTIEDEPNFLTKKGSGKIPGKV